MEHAFGQIAGRAAFMTEIRKLNIFWIIFTFFSETNIQRHEKPDSTRISLRNEFCEFDDLFEKCLRGDRNERPRDAIELRSEAIFADFLERLENGARPSDLVRPPFEDEKETQIRELKEEIAAKSLNEISI